MHFSPNPSSSPLLHCPYSLPPPTTNLFHLDLYPKKAVHTFLSMIVAMGHTCHLLIIIAFSLISFHTLLSVDYTNHASNKSFHNQHSKRLLFLEKFRVLLGLRSRNGDFPHFSVSPAPAPAPGPGIAPAPSPAAHRRAHVPLRHRHPLPQAHKVREQGRGRGGARVMTAVIASAGVTSALCAVAVFFGCRKFKKRRRKQRRRGLSKFISSAKKVTSDPGPDLFYLNSLESALEPEKCCLKLNSAAEDICSDEREVKLTDSEAESGEITTVHEISECVKHERDDGSTSSCGERIIPEEIHKFDDKAVDVEVEANSINDGDGDDDDESFHSFCDSQTRLSNASASSVGETSENISHEEVTEAHCSTSTAASKIPPPPPPPPLPWSPVFPPKSKTVSSSTLLSRLPASSPVPPPPPCPPPLSNGNGKASPLPPPSVGTHQMQVPLGKDGCPLPKLKPLHWDKVRAAPNRSTVWDKMRSSSFE